MSRQVFRAGTGHALYAAQVLTQQLYLELSCATLRDLAGGGMIMQPSSFRDLENPEIKAATSRKNATIADGRCV